MTDVVNHPPHYQTAAGIEAIEVMEHYGLGLHLGAAMKYLLRAGRKGDRSECLKKAEWYVRRWLAWDWWDKDPCALDDGRGLEWHTPEQIVEAFGLTGAKQGKAVLHLLQAAAFGNEDTEIEAALSALGEAIAECEQMQEA